MKSIKALLGVFLIVLLALYAVEAKESEKRTETKEKKGTSMARENILSDKHAFYGLKVEAEDVKIDVIFNGIELYSNWDEIALSTFVPINPYIMTGKNELKVKLFGNKLKINQLSKCKVQLYYINNEYKMKQVLTTLAFDNAKSKNKLEGSSKAGEINAIATDYSPLGLSEIEIKKPIILEGEEQGMSLSQYISLSTPFPKWKFLDSEKISNKSSQEMNDEEYEAFKDSLKMTALYALQKEILDALVRKNVESIKHLFTERNEEMDIAFQFEGKKGDTAKELFYNLKKDANDERLEVYFYKDGKSSYTIEENTRVAYIDKAIIFNRKDKSGSETYHLKCRYEKGRWIITR